MEPVFNLDFRYADYYAGIVKDSYSIHLKVSKYSIEERENRKNNEDPEIIFSVSGIEGLYEELSNKSVELAQSLRAMP